MVFTGPSPPHSHCHLPHPAAHLGAIPLSFSSSLDTAQPLLPAGQISVSPSSLPPLHPSGLNRGHEKREDTGKSDGCQEPPHCHQLPASPATDRLCPALLLSPPSAHHDGPPHPTAGRCWVSSSLGCGTGPLWLTVGSHMVLNVPQGRRGGPRQLWPGQTLTVALLCKCPLPILG